MTDSSRQSDGPTVRAELKELLEHILISVDYAPEDQQRSLLSSLRNWQRGERRKHPRKSCSAPVRVGVWRVFTEQIRDISVGGVFIKTSTPFAEGEQLTLVFSLPNRNGLLKITGHVVWNSPEGVGVEFTQPLSKQVEEVVDSL